MRTVKVLKKYEEAGGEDGEVEEDAEVKRIKNFKLGNGRISKREEKEKKTKEIARRLTRY